MELLLTDVRGWEERADLAGSIAAGLPHAQLWRQAEARMLAQRVAELVHSGRARAGEVVVLLRAVGDLEVFERALQLQGLRTLAAVGAFWGHQQIGDLLAYLRALANPLDERALYAALASPLAGCSRDGLALLADAARASRRGRVGDGPGRGRRRSRCRRARARARRPCRARVASAPVCRASAQRPRRGRSRAASSGRSTRAATASTCSGSSGPSAAWPTSTSCCVSRGDSKRARDATCGAFSTTSSTSSRRSTVEPDAPVEGVEPDAVRLMTIHAAKGLEFPVVCVADLGRQPEHADAGPARGRRARRPAAGAARRRRLQPRAGLRGALRGAPARAKPRRRTGSCTWR